MKLTWFSTAMLMASLSSLAASVRIEDPYKFENDTTLAQEGAFADAEQSSDEATFAQVGAFTLDPQNAQVNEMMKGLKQKVEEKKIKKMNYSEYQLYHKLHVLYRGPHKAKAKEVYNKLEAFLHPKKDSGKDDKKDA